MTPKRLLLIALAVVLVAVLVAPVTCSQSSTEGEPRCDTLLGYWTPFGEWVQGLIFLALVLAAVAVSDARRAWS